MSYLQIADSYSESNASLDDGLYSSNNANGQTFRGDGRRLHSADFYIYKVGTVTGTVYAKLYNISGTSGVNGKPTGSAIAISEGIDVSNIQTFPRYLQKFIFKGANRVKLDSSTDYAITIEFSGTNFSNCIRYSLDNSSPSHSGNRVFTNFSGWESTAGVDTIFYVYTKPLENPLPGNN